MTRFPLRSLLACLHLLLSAGALAAQQGAPDVEPLPMVLPRQVDWVGEFTVLSANALLGALTAGVVQKVRGGSFADGFTRGAAGGSIVYVGKRIAARRFEGAGLLGREVAAVGSSVIRNAADGVPSFERLIFPVGPLRVYVSPGEPSRVQAKVDLQTLFWIGYGFLEPNLQLDGRASLSAGTPVFVAHDHLIRWKRTDRRVHGTVPAGVILLSNVPSRGAAHYAETFAHERIHVLQFDQVLSTWVDPLEVWLLPHLPLGERIGRHVNVLTPLVIFPLMLVGEYESRPWEMEADYLSR